MIRSRLSKKWDALKSRALYALSHNMPMRQIRVDNRPYLDRYFLGQAFGFTFYLHHFRSDDGDREVHDHPWRHSFSLVLSGGYWEERVWGLDADRGLWLHAMRLVTFGNYLSALSFHRIDYVRPNTWTLFFHTTPRVKGWGFFDTDSSLKILFYSRGKLAAEKPTAESWFLTAPSRRDLERAKSMELL